MCVTLHGKTTQETQNENQTYVKQYLFCTRNQILPLRDRLQPNKGREADLILPLKSGISMPFFFFFLNRVHLPSSLQNRSVIILTLKLTEPGLNSPPIILTSHIHHLACPYNYIFNSPEAKSLHQLLHLQDRQETNTKSSSSHFPLLACPSCVRHEYLSTVPLPGPCSRSAGQRLRRSAGFCI